jgi:CubicO group peptidase (beta-lactamase class C family)
MKIYRLVPVSLALAVIAIAAGAQSPAPLSPDHEHAVDAFMKQQMTARRIPGAAVAVVSQGKVVLLRGYGLADVEHSVPVTEHTVFELASVTKQFTATAIMMLVQDKKFSLDDTLAAVLDSLPKAWHPITIRQLLNHTSGIPDFARREFHMEIRRDYSHREILGLVANAPLDFAPGNRHSYSNTGYFLLGMVIEKMSGKDYGAFLRERIFQPLGMTDTRFNDRSAIIPNRARGYAFVEGTLQNAEYTNPAIPFAAGGLASSAADMAKWMQAQGSEKLLTRANWEQMWAPTRLNDGTNYEYGFGWNVRTSWSRKRVEHAGGIQGFSTYVTHFFDDNLSVIVLLNLDGGKSPRLAWGIWGTYLPAAQYKPPKPIADADPPTTDFLRRVTVALAQGTGEPNWFTPKVQRFYFPDRIKARKAMIGTFGPLRSFDLTEVKEEPGRQKRTYRAVFGTTPLRFSYWVTPDHKVDDVDFEVE